MRHLLILGPMLITSLITANAQGENLYPLSVGNEWTYKIQSTYPRCPSGEKTSSVLQETTISGRQAFEVQGPCTGYPPGFIAAQDDRLDSEYNGTWWRFLEPAREGHSWQEFRTVANWQSIGTVSVEAGTFPNCWRKVRNVSYVDWTDFCPNVGIVRSHMVDLGGGNIDLELKSFKVK